jgi:hypothetical protein
MSIYSIMIKLITRIGRERGEKKTNNDRFGIGPFKVFVPSSTDVNMADSFMVMR